MKNYNDIYIKLNKAAHEYLEETPWYRNSSIMTSVAYEARELFRQDEFMRDSELMHSIDRIFDRNYDTYHAVQEIHHWTSALVGDDHEQEDNDLQ